MKRIDYNVKRYGSSRPNFLVRDVKKLVRPIYPDNYLFKIRIALTCVMDSFGLSFEIGVEGAEYHSHMFLLGIV